MLVILAAVFYFYGDNLFKNNNEIYEENKTAMFNVNKIQYYSDVNAVSNRTTYQNPEWNLNVYQYTDIALYIERLDDFSSENYIKSLNISDIKISDSKKGTQKIYYLNPLAYGNGDILNINSENEIKGILEYNIMNYENEDNDVKYSIPIFFEDCSNPITLRYVNNDILSNYVIGADEQISFNGSLLKRANILLEDIKADISLKINIITQNNETHSVDINIEIPLESTNKQIYDGSINIQKENLKYNF